MTHNTMSECNTILSAYTVGKGEIWTTLKFCRLVMGRTEQNRTEHNLFDKNYIVYGHINTYFVRLNAFTNAISCYMCLQFQMI